MLFFNPRISSSILSMMRIQLKIVLMKSHQTSLLLLIGTVESNQKTSVAEAGPRVRSAKVAKSIKSPRVSTARKKGRRKVESEIPPRRRQIPACRQLQVAVHLLRALTHGSTRLNMYIIHAACLQNWHM